MKHTISCIIFVTDKDYVIDKKHKNAKTLIV